MDIHTIRQESIKRSVYALSLRVTYYARVSLEPGKQLNSLSSQIACCEDRIRKNKA